MELISLAMPIHNTAPYVEQALRSALLQSYLNLEIILVDDRGSDNSMAIVRSLLASLPHLHPVRIITHPTNLGTGAARNSAIDAANGSFLFFMDSDDILPRDCIQLLYAQMLRHPADFVQGAYTSFHFDQPAPTPPFHFIPAPPLIESRPHAMIHILDSVMIWNKLYSTAFLRKHHIRCIPSHSVEDPFFSLQVAIHTQTFSTIPNITYLYRTRPRSLKPHSPQILSHLIQMFRASTDLLNDATHLSPTLRRMFKRKLFFSRLFSAQLVASNPTFGYHYINDFLSSRYLRDFDTLRSPILAFAFLLAIAPLKLKILLLKLHAHLYKSTS
jgi:glycosyltransferase involved in cell wall biosynthesis